MKRWTFCLALIAIAGSCFSLRAHASEIPLSVSIGTESPPEVPCFWVPEDTNGYGGYWVFGEEHQAYPEFEWDSPDPEGGSVEIEGTLDPDPAITFFITATDNGAPSNFAFSFILPLNPQVTNPSRVFDSLSGSVTNGLAGGNVTVTALAPPAGVQVDGDGITELQVYTLSQSGGAGPWLNVGLDAGKTEVIPLGSGQSGDYPSYNQGFIPTIAGGPWTHMRVDINFRLSGGGDIFTLNGAKVLIPEPGTLVLGLMSLGSLCLVRGRRIR